MEFQSKELLNAQHVKPNLTHVDIDSSETDELKKQIKIFLLLKDKKLLDWYELHSLKSNKTMSGIEVLISILNTIRDEFISENKEDNIKNLTIRKVFDNLISSLSILAINKVDLSSDIINTIMLSYISKNFLI